MEAFTYKGIAEGKYVEGEIEALNQDEASHKLKEQKVIITNLIKSKKKKAEGKDKAKNAYMFFMMFIEKNKGFTRLLSREALSNNEQNVLDNVNQFYERFELILRQMLKEEASNLVTQPGISAQLIVTCIEGNIGRYIRSKFKVSPSTYIENVWELLSRSIFKN